MDEKLRQLLKIPYNRLDDINAVLLNPDMQVINNFLEVVEKYGSPEEINRQAEQARQLPNLLEKVKAVHPEYLPDLRWLEQQRDQQAFISVPEYRRIHPIEEICLVLLWLGQFLTRPTRQRTSFDNLGGRPNVKKNGTGSFQGYACGRQT